MNDELPENIASWLTETGFPLEMRVQAHLDKIQIERRGFAFANPAYSDPETGKIREGGDVVLNTHEVEQRMVDGVWFQYRSYVFSVIECKNPKKPWIAFLKKQQPGYRLIHSLTSDVRGLRILNSRMSRPEYRKPLEKEIGRESLLLAPKECAYSIIDYKSNGQSNHAYNAVRQVLDASQGIVDEHSEYYSDPAHKNFTLFGALSFIVTSGKIFSCSLDEGGNPVVQPEDSIVYVEERGQSKNTSFVRIMTEDFFYQTFGGIIDHSALVNQTLSRILLEVEGQT